MSKVLHAPAPPSDGLLEPRPYPGQLFLEALPQEINNARNWIVSPIEYLEHLEGDRDMQSGSIGTPWQGCIDIIPWSGLVANLEYRDYIFKI